MDDGVRPAEQGFADVLNGLSFNRRARRPERVEGAHAQPARPHMLLDDEPPEEENAAIVRAYTWTGGRTRSDVQLEIQTLVSTSRRAWEQLDSLSSEHQAVARLCRESKSVAEVSALLSVPLGVVRVLLGDMAALGLVDVHANDHAAGDRPSVELLQRVLRGLNNLRAAPTG